MTKGDAMTRGDTSTKQIEAVADDELGAVSGGRDVDGVRNFLFPAGTGGLDLAAKGKAPKSDTIDQIDLWVGGISE